MPATATKKDYVTAEQLLEPRPMPIDLPAHQKDLARRQAEADAQRPELLKCLSPKYAKMREDQKPKYRWTVKATWVGLNPNAQKQDHVGNDDNDDENSPIAKFEIERVVKAQDERHAWALFCDKIKRWPCRRDVKVVFTRGARVNDEVTGEAIDDDVIPTVKL